MEFNFLWLKMTRFWIRSISERRKCPKRTCSPRMLLGPRFCSALLWSKPFSHKFGITLIHFFEQDGVGGEWCWGRCSLFLINVYLNFILSPGNIWFTWAMLLPKSSKWFIHTDQTNFLLRANVPRPKWATQICPERPNRPKVPLCAV